MHASWSYLMPWYLNWMWGEELNSFNQNFGSTLKYIGFFQILSYPVGSQLARISKLWFEFMCWINPIEWNFRIHHKPLYFLFSFVPLTAGPPLSFSPVLPFSPLCAREAPSLPPLMSRPHLGFPLSLSLDVPSAVKKLSASHARALTCTRSYTCQGLFRAYSLGLADPLLPFSWVYKNPHSLSLLGCWKSEICKLVC